MDIPVDLVGQKNPEHFLAKGLTLAWDLVGLPHQSRMRRGEG